ASRQALEALAAMKSPSVPDDVRWARRTLAVQLALAPSAGAFQKAVALLEANKINGALTADDQRARVLVLVSQKGLPLPEGRTARQEAIRTLEELQKQRSARAADDLLLLARL